MSMSPNPIKVKQTRLATKLIDAHSLQSSCNVIGLFNTSTGYLSLGGGPKINLFLRIQLNDLYGSFSLLVYTC